RMKTTSPIKGGLPTADCGRSVQHDLSRDGRLVGRRRCFLTHELERPLPTYAARRREVEAALVLWVASETRLHAHVDSVRGKVASRTNLDDVFGSADQPFAGEEAGRQLLVLAGRAHRHRER